ncbi:uncharacterized protein LOC119690108 [Teleopsis dalmanni]|uniref:uncharacterized protein LOC119690108 n=1 Tax=Teleopsis dalmanni TaxID=139649 RepID=UPI0018CCB56C|nr:uncharacterized protein LOC119690108 [Teleopsis dalmanni]
MPGLVNKLRYQIESAIAEESSKVSFAVKTSNSSKKYRISSLKCSTETTGNASKHAVRSSLLTTSAYDGVPHYGQWSNGVVKDRDYPVFMSRFMPKGFSEELKAAVKLRRSKRERIDKMWSIKEENVFGNKTSNTVSSDINGSLGDEDRDYPVFMSRFMPKGFSEELKAAVKLRRSKLERIDKMWSIKEENVFGNKTSNTVSSDINGSLGDEDRDYPVFMSRFMPKGFSEELKAAVKLRRSKRERIDKMWSIKEENVFGNKTSNTVSSDINGSLGDEDRDYPVFMSRFMPKGFSEELKAAVKLRRSKLERIDKMWSIKEENVFGNKTSNTVSSDINGSLGDDGGAQKVTNNDGFVSDQSHHNSIVHSSSLQQI